MLNGNIFYPDTGAWESPRRPSEWVLLPGVLPALGTLADAGFLLFLVSNQPNAVNGKSTPEALAATHGLLLEHLRAAAVRFTDFFYCAHHPRYTGACPCRKPSPFFLQHAARTYGLDLAASWMVGDRVTDMQCGRAAGTRTAWICTGQEPDTPDNALVDLACASLPEAVKHMLTAC